MVLKNKTRINCSRKMARNSATLSLSRPARNHHNPDGMNRRYTKHVIQSMCTSVWMDESHTKHGHSLKGSIEQWKLASIKVNCSKTVNRLSKMGSAYMHCSVHSVWNRQAIPNKGTIWKGHKHSKMAAGCDIELAVTMHSKDIIVQGRGVSHI